tara:strand:+ start:60 stop:509 length:450 start_codon:yes stop_codon:yes gene_type:complete
MRNYLIVLLFLFTLNCTLNKVSNTHGFKFNETKYNNIILNKTNKNDIKSLIGPPSSISKFNDTWIYIERKKTNQSIFKLGKKRISDNNIILIEFNSMGTVKDKKFLNLNDMNDIKIAEKVTSKKFNQNNTLYNILSTLREKVNAPRRKK